MSAQEGSETEMAQNLQTSTDSVCFSNVQGQF